MNMIKSIYTTAAALAMLFAATTTGAAPIKVATWNIEWLNEYNHTGSERRDDSDYDALRNYAGILDADIIVLQEIDGVNAIKRVLDEDEYNFYFSSRNHSQKVGIAYRGDLTVLDQRELQSFDVNGQGHLRYGVEMTFLDNGQPFTVLALHLKSFCFSQPLEDTENRSCETLTKQLDTLEHWINQQARSGIPFIIAGDLNRRLHANDDFWLEINDGYPEQAILYSPAMSATSTCNGGRYPDYIDHIIMDALATQAYIPGSFSQVVYSEDDSAHFKLSDHCPISVTLDF